MAISLTSAAAPMMSLAAESSDSNAAHIAGQVFSCLLAIVIVAAALGMVLSRKLIHSALSLLLVMIGIAVEYAVLEAPFVFAVQIIVYAGAIMVMFIFIVMMVGSTPISSGKDPIPGQRVAAIIMALAVVIVMAIAIMLVSWQDPAGMEEANAAAGGNIAGLGAVIFGRYVVLFELVSALLTIGAVGAIVLTLRTRIKNRPTQHDAMEARIKAYAEKGIDPGAMPSTGVYATTNAMDVPALLPDGTEAKFTLPQEILEEQPELARSAQELSEKTKHTYDALDEMSGKDE